MVDRKRSSECVLGLLTVGWETVFHPRSTHVQPTAALSNKKTAPLRDGLNTSWGLVFDRIGETGFEPAASCSQSKQVL